MLVDTHAHLHWPSLAADLDVVLSRAGEAGITRILTLGTEPESCRAAVAIAAEHDEVYAAVGIHPGDVSPGAAAALEQVSALLDHAKVVAIGETGLDYYHADSPPRDEQIASFERHLRLAEQTGKPVSVHNREATEDVMALLTVYEGRCTAILHCFTGDLETARAAIAMGHYISLAGNATYPKLRHLLEAASSLPDDRLLVETDAPFLAPLPLRGRRNEPANIAYTYDAVAAARGTTRADLGRVVSANAARLFGWAGAARGRGEAA